MARLIVLQGVQRSGSNWLLSLLNDQPHLAVHHSELLHPSTFEGGYVAYYLRAMNTLLHNAPPGWLERPDPAFDYFNVRQQIAGDYLQSLTNSRVAQHLLIHVKLEQLEYFPEVAAALYSSDVDFIILERMNVLAQAVSGEVMRHSGVSHYTSADVEHQVSLNLDPGYLLSQMRVLTDLQQRYTQRAQASGRRCVTVQYEDLVAQGPEAVLAPVFASLGVAVSGLASTMVKSPTPSLSELLVNFDEIRAAVQASEFAYTLALPE